MYAVSYRKSAQKDIKKLPTTIRKRVIHKITLLAKNPRPDGSVKLRGYDELHRIRIGVYRVVYEIHDDKLIIIIVSAEHRKDIYKNL